MERGQHKGGGGDSELIPGSGVVRDSLDGMETLHCTVRHSINPSGLYYYTSIFAALRNVNVLRSGFANPA